MTEEAADAAESESTEDASAADPENASATDREDPTAGSSPDESGGASVDQRPDESAASDETEAQDEAGEDDVAERVAEYDEELAEAVRERVDSLEAELAEREEEREELASRLKRTQADFQNYKKRAKKRQDQLKERATEDLVERLVTVRDNLLRALDQDEGADIRGGVESTLKEFDRILEEESVAPIEPEPGDEVDPHRHEVMMRVESEQAAGTVADLYQSGYEMGEKVLRPAQVTVSADEDG